MNKSERYYQAKKVTLIGAFINALLGFMKLIGGVVFHSHALVADGVHSFADLVTDAMVLFASKYGSQDADESHQYGHKRIETATTFILALLLILAGIGIVWDAIVEILFEHLSPPDSLALAIAATSIIANEILFHYTRKVGQRIKSELIIANAWHHRSDAGASAVVVVGLIGSLLGWGWCDTLAALAVGGMIIHMGFSYGWDSIKELVDTAAEPQLLEKIEHIILTIHGVKKIHQLRTRMMGGDVYIDVHIQVSSYLSVSEGHFIAQHVHMALLNQLERVQDVTVHVDPEDDETSEPSFHLPNRQALELLLLTKWATAFPTIQSWTIHYLKGTISIDLLCDESLNLDGLHQYIHTELQSHPNINRIRLLRHSTTLDIIRAQ